MVAESRRDIRLQLHRAVAVPYSYRRHVCDDNGDGVVVVAVTAASEPWVCKLQDFKKEEYQRKLKEKKQKRMAQPPMKELPIRVKSSTW